MEKIKPIKYGDYIGRKITNTVEINVIRTLGFELCDDGSSDGYSPRPGLNWIESEEERVLFLKKYMGGDYLYAFFYECNSQVSINFEEEKHNIELGKWTKENDVVYLFSDFKSSHKNKPRLVTYEKFCKIVNVKKWGRGIKKEFLKNNEGKALLHNDNDTLLGANKFIII